MFVIESGYNFAVAAANDNKHSPIVLVTIHLTHQGDL